MGNQSHSTRIRGLDGLRTLAVFLVLGYHLLVGVFNSGFIGVDVFFVISGFLITSLLLREEETSGRISLHAFWLRRLRRLVPAVVVATFVTVALAGLVGGDSAVQLRWQSLGAVTGTYNWLEIAFHSSYFEAQSPLLLTNMWSLAVEQQFYVVWPLLLLSVIRFIPRRLRPLVAIVLATASFAGTAFLMQQGEDVTRAYVGTDTHSFGLMIGAALALSLPGLMNGKRDDVSPRRVRVYGVAGWIGGIAVVALAVFVPDKASFYPWVMLGASIATAFLIRAMLPDMGQGVLTRALWAVFHSPVMCWIGERSYGIYLWHWPLWVIAYYWAHLPVLVVAVIVTALSFVFAHLSYVFIETPIRREGFRVVTSRVVSFFRNPERIIVATMPVFLSIVVLVVALVTSPNMNSAQQFVYDGQKGTQSTQSSRDILVPIPLPKLEDYGAPMPTGDQITLIGDSVSLGSSASLEERLAGIYIDAVVSRNITHVPAIIDSLLAQGNLRDYVVVAVSANSTITTEDVDALVKQIGKGRRLVLVTGYGPERCTWIPPTNSVIYEAAKKYPRKIRVADWASLARDNQGLLAGDRVHPNPYNGGTDLFADELVRALDSF